jgi:hypothetical protein
MVAKHCLQSTDRPLPPRLREAFEDSLFRAQWNDRSDPGFRPFVAAVFAFANIAQLPDASRRDLYRAICTTKRSLVLSRVSGAPATQATVNLIAKSAWTRFARYDWESLLVGARQPRKARALATLSHVSVDLVR